MIKKNQFRERLNKAIKESGMPQTESANNSGKIQPSIAQYFSGRSMPSIETFAKICAVLDLDANKILCLDQFNRDIKITKNTVNGEIKK